MSERKYIQHYHSTTSGSVPAAEDLLVGEIAINVADGKIYTKNENNEIITLNEKQDLIVPIRYHELVALRNEDKLIPGVKYRIIDYECTTSDPETQSAGHRFDIIVTALNKNTLSEEASAIQNEYSYEEEINGKFLVEGNRIFTLESEANIPTEISIAVCTVFYKEGEQWSMTTGTVDGELAPYFDTLPSEVTVTVTHNEYDEACSVTESSSQSFTVVPSEPIAGTILGIGHFEDNNCVMYGMLKTVQDDYTEFIFCALGDASDEILVTENCTPVTKTVIPDTYFDKSDLKAWKINYTLDNNSFRFNWAEPDTVNGFALNPNYNLYKVAINDNVLLQTNIIINVNDKEYFYWDSINDVKYLTEYKIPYIGGKVYVYDENAETISEETFDIISFEKLYAYGPVQEFSGSNIIYYFCSFNPNIGDVLYQIAISGHYNKFYTFGSFSELTVNKCSFTGKGVIYRMIDEFGNDCPYDFKNLLYFNGDGQTVFTFSNQSINGTFLDASVNRYGTGKVARNNKIESVSSTYDSSANTFYAFTLPWNVLINPGNSNRFYNSRYNYIDKASGCEFINSNENFINAHSYQGVNFSNNKLVFKSSDQNRTNCAFTNVSFIACSDNTINASSLWRPGNYEFKGICDSEVTVPTNDYISGRVLTISENSSGEVKIYNVADLIA